MRRKHPLEDGLLMSVETLLVGLIVWAMLAAPAATGYYVLGLLDRLGGAIATAVASVR